MKDNLLVVTCGPTATGKTSLALELCQKFDGEIVSIDSRQVYRGLEIGSGKSIPNNKYEVPNTRDGYWDIKDKGTGDVVRVHLYDLLEPNEELNVVQFAKIAGPIVERIWARGKIPFLVGGAGLYFEVLLGQVAVAKVEPDPELRQRLGRLSNEELLAKLKELDLERVRTVDPNSPHRLIRAIEIAKARPADSSTRRVGDGKPDGFSSAGIGSSGDRKPKIVEVLPQGIDPLWVGLNAPRKFLYEKIDQRVNEMVAEGLLDEIQALVEECGWKVPALNSIGYVEFKPYFEKKATLEECIERVKFDSHAYVRRQLTWFRRNKNIRWFDITEPGFEKEVGRMVESYLEG